MYIRIKAKPAEPDQAQTANMRINTEHVVSFRQSIDALDITCLNEMVKLPASQYHINEAYNEMMIELPQLGSTEVIKTLVNAKLLPCPMCSGKAVMRRLDAGYTAGCSHCKIGSPSLKDEYSALVYWNYMIAD